MAPETTAYRDDGSVDVPFPGHDDAFSDNCGASVKGIVLRGCAAARDLPAATGRTAKEGALRLASACRSLRSKASAAGSAAGAGLGPAGLAVAAKAMKARGALGQVRQGLSKKHVRYRALAALAIAATTLFYFSLIYFEIRSIYATTTTPPSCGTGVTGAFKPASIMPLSDATGISSVMPPSSTSFIDPAGGYEVSLFPFLTLSHSNLHHLCSYYISTFHGSWCPRPSPPFPSVCRATRCGL